MATATYADPGLAALRAPTAARLRGRRAFEVIVESAVTEASAAVTAAIVDLS